MSNRFVFLLFKLWLLLSSFYYVDTLFSAEFASSIEEGSFHKISKYIVCYFFSSYLLIKARYWHLFIVSNVMLLFSVIIVFIIGSIDLSVVVMLIFSTMFGFVATLRVWRDCQIEISRLVVVSGSIVGVGSILELTLLSDTFYSYWAATGGVRSISTLLNPNNLGLYAGVCLLLLVPTFASTTSRLFLGLPIVFAFIASGSRTAWASLSLVFLFALMFDNGFRTKLWQELRKHWFLMFLVLSPVVLGFIVFLDFSGGGQFDSSTRGLDLYTASVRMENFFKFLDLVDWTILIPELHGPRAELVQDNFYLMILNSFGLVLSILVSLFFVLGIRFCRVKKNFFLSVWHWIVIYYLISGLSGSFISSFPNNQMFFIAAGAFLIGRVTKQRGCLGSP